MPTINYQGALQGPADSRYTMGQHGTATPASGTFPEFQRIGGMVDTSTGTYAAGVDVVRKLDRRGWDEPHLDYQVLFSTTTAGSAATATGTWLTGLGGLKYLEVLLDVTATSGLAPTLDVYLDTRYDGTSTINLARFGNQVAIGKTGIVLAKGQSSAVSDVALTADAGAGTARNFGWADDLRVRYIVSGVTGTFSFQVILNGVA